MPRRPEVQESQQSVYALTEFWKTHAANSEQEAFGRLDHIAVKISELQPSRLRRLISDWSRKHKSNLTSRRSRAAADGIVELINRSIGTKTEIETVLKGLRSTVEQSEQENLLEERDKFYIWLMKEERQKIIQKREELLRQMEEPKTDLSAETFQEFSQLAQEDTVIEAKTLANARGRPPKDRVDQRKESLEILENIQSQVVEAGELIRQKLKIANQPYVELLQGLLDSLAGTRATSVQQAKKATLIVNELAQILVVDLIINSTKPSEPLRLDAFSDLESGKVSFVFFSRVSGKRIGLKPSFPSLRVSAN